VDGSLDSVTVRCGGTPKMTSTFSNTLAHPHHGIGIDQLLKFDEHRMEFDVIASGIDPLPVSGEPGLQIVLIVGQPAGPAADIHSTRRTRRHSETLLDRETRLAFAPTPAEGGLLTSNEITFWLRRRRGKPRMPSDFNAAWAAL
jgi:hypothetical protein